MSSIISKPVKHKRVNLSMVKKLELNKDIEKGTTVKSVFEKYGVKRHTVSDIRKNKEKLEKFAASYCIDASSSKWQSWKQKAHENKEGGVFRCGSYEVVCGYRKACCSP